MSMDILQIIVRSLAVYFFLVLAIRIFGKRELAQLSVVDLVFILLISNAVQNAMVGPDNSLLGGIIAATSLFIGNRLLQFAFARSQKLSHFFQGDVIMLIYKGKILKDHLKKAAISQEELEETIREHGVSDSTKVDLAVLETDGNISVLSNNYQHKTIRKRKSHKIISKNN